MRTMKILLAMVLIATQVQAAVVSNFIGREIPRSIVVSATAASYTLGAVTFTDVGDLVTLNNHGLSNGEAVTFGTITTTTGISINTTYYVISSTTNTFQLSATVGGAALPLTTNGTGVLSSSYYAIVKAQVDRGGTFSLNGVVALSSHSTTWSVLSSSPMTYLATGSGNRLGVETSASGVTGNAFASATAQDTSNAVQEFKVPAGTVIVGSGNARYSIEIYKI